MRNRKFHLFHVDGTPERWLLIPLHRRSGTLGTQTPAAAPVAWHFERKIVMELREFHNLRNPIGSNYIYTYHTTYIYIYKYTIWCVYIYPYNIYIYTKWIYQVESLLCWELYVTNLQDGPGMSTSPKYGPNNPTSRPLTPSHGPTPLRAEWALGFLGYLAYFHESIKGLEPANFPPRKRRNIYKLPIFFSGSQPLVFGPCSWVAELIFAPILHPQPTWIRIRTGSQQLRHLVIFYP